MKDLNQELVDIEERLRLANIELVNNICNAIDFDNAHTVAYKLMQDNTQVAEALLEELLAHRILWSMNNEPDEYTKSKEGE